MKAKLFRDSINTSSKNTSFQQEYIDLSANPSVHELLKAEQQGVPVLEEELAGSALAAYHEAGLVWGAQASEAQKELMLVTEMFFFV